MLLGLDHAQQKWQRPGTVLANYGGGRRALRLIAETVT
jgi:hypothetical protein